MASWETVDENSGRKAADIIAQELTHRPLWIAHLLWLAYDSALATVLAHLCEVAAGHVVVDAQDQLKQLGLDLGVVLVVEVVVEHLRWGCQRADVHAFGVDLQLLQQVADGDWLVLEDHDHVLRILRGLLHKELQQQLCGHAGLDVHVGVHLREQRRDALYPGVRETEITGVGERCSM